jgi:Mg2+ and Co2+ transporter CorA
MRRAFTERLKGLRGALRKPVNNIFNEDLMTLLAFLIIPSVILPYLLTFSEFTLSLFEALNYLIIAAFVAEYVLKLYVADSRRKFVLGPWQVLDLLIIALALAEFLPFVATSAGRASPLLRLLRLLRAFAAAGRTIKASAHTVKLEPVVPTVSSMTVRMLTGGKVSKCSMADSVCDIVAGERRWIDLQNVADIDLPAVSRTLDVPLFVLKGNLATDSFPRIDYFPAYTTIFLGDAKLELSGPGPRDFLIRRHGMLIVCARSHVVTVRMGESALFDEVITDGVGDGEELAVRVLYDIFRRKLRDAEDIVRAIEQRTAWLEEMPVGRTPPSFLEDTFYLKREIQKFTKVLWHFRQVLDSLRGTKVALEGMTDEDLARFDVLYDEADYLYETALNINDSLSSLRELHINTVTYEMTRTMRVIAVLTCLALIPTIIGGLLGENLMDTPYAISIWEIGLLVISLMLIALYAFYKMGWLR